MQPYSYNTFDLMRDRLTDVDIQNISDLIHNLPLQKEIEIEGKKCLFAHAMTSHPNVIKKRSHYLMGGCLIDEFYKDGVDGYISFAGHFIRVEDSPPYVWTQEKSIIPHRQ